MTDEPREELPVLDHLTGEFLAWLWFMSEALEGRIDLGEPIGSVEFWVDERMAFRTVEEDRPRTVLTGDQPSRALEARAALAGGKVLCELRLGLRREDREYTFSLGGPLLDVKALKVPQAVRDGDLEEVVADRMFLAAEVVDVVRALFRAFARDRVDPCWSSRILPAMQAWAAGAEAVLPASAGG